MPCFYPMQALPYGLTKNGKPSLSFIPKGAGKSFSKHPGLVSGIPCGQCVGCRLEKSRQWAIRMVNEASLYSSNCFITLTFDEESLLQRDSPMSLDKREFQLFMKRLRKRFKGIDKVFDEFGKESFPIRFYMCGEYGERFRRPHYHAILFNFDFPDKVLEKIENGKRYYSSAILRELWSFGNNIITDVNFDTCAYVARYIMKKHLGKDALLQYCEYIDEISGEIAGLRIPEYTNMSRRSGIGKEWLKKHLLDVFPRDEIFLRGRGFSKPPKYYDSLYEIINPSDYSRIKQDRKDVALNKSSESTPDRLHAKQAVKLAQISVLSRSLE